MKRIIAFGAVAVLLCGFCSCDDKPETSEPIGVVTSTEPTFIELSEGDFTPIDTIISEFDGEAPIELKTIDLNGIDFGKRLSPCKAPELNERYHSKIDYRDEEQQKQYENAWERLVTSPCKGFCDNTFFCSGMVFLEMNYDDLCGQHDDLLFCFNPEIGSCSRVIETAKAGRIEAHTCVGDCLCFIMRSDNFDDSDDINVYCYDTKTHKSSELFTEKAVSKCEEYLLSQSHGELIFCEGSYDFEGDSLHHSKVLSVDIKSGKSTELINIDKCVSQIKEYGNNLLMSTVDNDNHELYEYNYSSGTLNKISDSSKDVAEAFAPAPLCDGVPSELTGGLDGETPLTVKTQYYTVETELLKYVAVYVWNDYFSVWTTDKDRRNCLYTYDIVNRECIKLTFSKKYIEFMEKSGDGVCVGIKESMKDSETKLYYVVPKLGIQYLIGTGGCYNSSVTDGTTYIISTITPEENVKYALKVLGFNFGNQTFPDKLFIIS